jgi:hypothetical protein
MGTASLNKEVSLTHVFLILRSPPSSTEVTNGGAIHLLPHMSGCGVQLIMPRNNCIFYLNIALIKQFCGSNDVALSKGCHLDVVRGPSTPHDSESDAGGSLSSWQGHPSR